MRGAETGADNLIIARYALGRATDAALRPQWWREERFWAKLGGFGYRLQRLYLLDLPLHHYAGAFDHEYFGHGYRGRE